MPLRSSFEMAINYAAEKFGSVIYGIVTAYERKHFRNGCTGACWLQEH
jgi:hypothetical protein